MENQAQSNAVALMTAVNHAEMRISTNPRETLVAFSIGSGMGVTIYDPICATGGVLNFLLPDSTRLDGVNPEKKPFMFADTGIAAFLNELYEQGVRPERVKAVIAGAARITDQAGQFNIGQKNCEAARRALEGQHIVIGHAAVGGTISRTLSLEIGSGCSCVKMDGRVDEKIWPETERPSENRLAATRLPGNRLKAGIGPRLAKFTHTRHRSADPPTRDYGQFAEPVG